jgi:hypothetical protein
VLPYNLLALTFGNGLNLSLEGIALPRALLAMTLDCELNQGFSFVFEFNQSLEDTTIGYAFILSFSNVFKFNLS